PLLDGGFDDLDNHGVVIGMKGEQEQPPVSVAVPLPIYQLLLLRSPFIPEDEIDRLGLKRPDVVAVMVDRLRRIDFGKPSIAPLRHFNRQVSRLYQDYRKPVPGQLRGAFFDAIVGLDAAETIPELLRLEGQLHGLIAAAET